MPVESVPQYAAEVQLAHRLAGLTDRVRAFATVALGEDGARWEGASLRNALTLAIDADPDAMDLLVYVVEEGIALHAELAKRERARTDGR